MPRAHKQKFSVGWWLKLAGLAPLSFTAVDLLVAAAIRGWRFANSPSHHNLNTWLSVVVAAVVTGALVYLGYRNPGLVGGLLTVAAPVGAFLGLAGWALGGGSTRGLVLVELALAGVPLASGLLLIVAGRWRTSGRLISNRRMRIEGEL